MCRAVLNINLHEGLGPCMSHQSHIPFSMVPRVTVQLSQEAIMGGLKCSHDDEVSSNGSLSRPHKNSNKVVEPRLGIPTLIKEVEATGPVIAMPWSQQYQAQNMTGALPAQ